MFQLCKNISTDFPRKKCPESLFGTPCIPFKLLGLGMSNMNFLICRYDIFLSDTQINFSQGDATKIKSKQFSEFGSWTVTTSDHFSVLSTCQKRPCHMLSVKKFSKGSSRQMLH